MVYMFGTVIDLSLRGSAVILMTIVIRFVLAGKSGAFSRILWVASFFTLVCPFTVSTDFAVLPRYDSVRMVENSSFIVSDIVLDNVSDIWIWGMFVLTIYQAISVLRMIKCVRNSQQRENLVYASSSINVPFVMGFFRPKIYIPDNMDGNELEMALAHEKVHIAHYDNVLKFAAWVVVTLHWFNPLVWLAYIMLCGDIEIACDETVIKFVDKEYKKNYAYMVLMHSSGENRLLNASSLGGAGVKRRVKKILQYEQKSRFQVGVYFLVFLCLMVVAGTEIRDMRPEIENLAEKWLISNYSVNYEVRNVVSKVLRKNDALEGERYVVRLECETKSRTDSGDVDSSQWEETTMEVVVLADEGLELISVF